MFHRCRLLLLACLVFSLLALPAAAAERVEELPEIEPAMSARLEMAIAINDQPFIVGRGEIESAERAYFTLKSLPVGDQPESTVEVVVYDGTLYVRAGEDPQWYIVPQEEAVPVETPEVQPEADIENAPITLIGPTEIAGVAVDQYQIWIAGAAAEGDVDEIDDPDATLDHIALDFWIGQQVKYLYQTQTSVFTKDPDIGDMKVESVTRMFDFNEPIKVYPPTNAQPLPTSATGFIRPLANGGILSTLNAPLATPQLRELAVRRFGH